MMQEREASKEEEAVEMEAELLYRKELELKIAGEQKELEERRILLRAQAS